MVEDGTSDEKLRARLAEEGLPSSDIFLLNPGVGGLWEEVLVPWLGGVGFSSGRLEVGDIGGVICLLGTAPDTGDGTPPAAFVIERRVLRGGCVGVVSPDVC